MDKIRILKDIFSQTKLWFIAVTGIQIFLNFYNVPIQWTHWVHKFNKIWLCIVFLQIGVWLLRAVSLVLSHLEKKHATFVLSKNVLSTILKSIVILGIILLILDNIGVKIHSLVAGLGIGGIAIALATQNLLGDIIAFLSIIWERPFLVGDTISAEDARGTVLRIGLKSTRLKNFLGEEVNISNGQMLKAKIINHSHIQERKCLISCYFSLNSPTDKIIKFRHEIQNIHMEHVTTLSCHLTKIEYQGEHQGIRIDSIFLIQPVEGPIFLEAQTQYLLSFIDKAQHSQLLFLGSPQVL